MVVGVDVVAGVEVKMEVAVITLEEERVTAENHNRIYSTIIS